MLVDVTFYFFNSIPTMNVYLFFQCFHLMYLSNSELVKGYPLHTFIDIFKYHCNIYTTRGLIYLEAQIPINIYIYPNG